MNDSVHSPDRELSFPSNGYIPEAIPDGDHYEVVFSRAERINQWGQDKIILWFKLITPGPWLNEEFFMASNVPPKSKWTLSCKFWRAFVLANGKRPNRRDRLSTGVFKNKVFRVKIRKVIRDSKQQTLTAAQQYSVIDRLIEVAAGGNAS